MFVLSLIDDCLLGSKCRDLLVGLLITDSRNGSIWVIPWLTCRWKTEQIEHPFLCILSLSFPSHSYRGLKPCNRKRIEISSLNKILYHFIEKNNHKHVTESSESFFFGNIYNPRWLPSKTNFNHFRFYSENKTALH